MKQVSSKIYDTNFFKKVYGKDNEVFNFESDLSKDYYYEMLNQIKLKDTDTVVDYGCGNGNLSFLLWKKYKCQVIGFDYSKDAIAICNQRLDKFKKKYPKSKIRFLVANNDSLPNLDSIKAVYFCDVLEHMYDSEIKKAMDAIKKWTKDRVTIVIHTDNNYYLRFVRPLINLIMVIGGKKTFKKLKEEKREEDMVHVNLTNFIALRKTLSGFGINHTKTSFPKITKQKIRKQISLLGRIDLIVNSCYTLLNLFPFLSPSFYSIYLYKPRKR